MGDLGRGRRLARALQPDQHDHDRRRGVEIDPLHPRAVEPTAEHLDEVVVDDLDDHLRWRHRAQHLLPQRLLTHRGDKVANHRQRHIGLEQGDADLAQGGADIILGQGTMATQPVEDVTEAIAEAIEHSGPQIIGGRQKAPVRETRGLAAPGI